MKTNKSYIYCVSISSPKALTTIITHGQNVYRYSIK